jgi:hypothetical protein
MSVYDNILDASNFTIVTITDYKDTYDSNYDYKGKTAQISPKT